MSKATSRRRKPTEDQASLHLPKDLSKSTAGASGPDQASPCESPLAQHELDKSAECPASDLLEASDIGGERCRPNLNQPPSQPCRPPATPSESCNSERPASPSKQSDAPPNPRSPRPSSVPRTPSASPRSLQGPSTSPAALQANTLIKSPGCAKSGASVLGKRS